MKHFHQVANRSTQIVLIIIFCLISLLGFATKYPPKKHQKPSYTIVFPQNKVNSIEINISKVQWDSIKADMKNKYGNDFGQGGMMPGMERMRPDKANGMPMPPNGMPMPPNFEDGGMMNFGKGEPNYFPISINFKGKTIQNVGFRLKGNSSLMMTWGKGVYKLPFRLDFEEFEKDKKKQKFYGFEKLSFSPAMSDKSLIREKVTADIFREAGIPAAQTAFYKVYINFGEGKKYCGVYTLVEVIEDTMIKTQFGTNDQTKGNIYKPESNLTKFKKEQFEKKNNKKQADWSDIDAFITVLNSPLRKSDASQWRTNLEETFNVEHFIKWLAANNTLVNWDTYGALPHNYYLYNSPTQKLTWIPWDNDQSLGLKMDRPEGIRPPNNASTDTKTPQRGRPPMMMGGPIGMGVSLKMENVGKNWPLIKAIVEDDIYFAKYKQYVREFTENVFTTEKMNALFEKNHKLISPFVIGKEKEQKPYSHLNNLNDFKNELEVLKKHVSERNEAVKKFLE
jgi:spore coat protein H